MRNYNDITPEGQTRILTEYNTGRVTFAQIESVYDVDAKSFFDFLQAQNLRAYHSFAPPTVAAQIELTTWQRFKRSAVYDLFKTLIVSLFVLSALVSSSYILQFLGIDPLNNELLSTAPKAAFFVVTAKMFTDVFFWVCYRLKFEYLNPNIQTAADYSNDFENLTPFERWFYVSLKFYFWVALFVWLLVTLNPQQSVLTPLLTP